MYDSFNRCIRYLRISVTDRCNIRCHYCMPAEGLPLKSHADILTFEEITAFTSEAVQMGVDKIRLTGGEPLVRRGIVDLITMLAQIPGIKDFGMTTNGILLTKMATAIHQAGIHRLNVSLDTLDPDRYKQITRIGTLQDALDGLKAADQAGFKRIKINCVIQESPDEPDALQIGQFAKDRGYEIQYIRQMNLKTGEFWTVIGGDGGNCESCSRLRLSSDGRLIPCLFSDQSINIRQYPYRQAIEMALANKPQSGHKSNTNQFYSVGG